MVEREKRGKQKREEIDRGKKEKDRRRKLKSMKR